jgi:aspartate aminotransferase-like enzyme
MRKSIQFQRHLAKAIQDYMKKNGITSWIKAPVEVRNFFIDQIYDDFMSNRELLYKKKTVAEKAKSALRNRIIRTGKLKKRWQKNG